MYIETKWRSLIKAISWRVLATTTTTIIVYIFFKRLELAILAGLTESIVKIAVYFLHERVWQKIKFGKKKVTPFVLWFTGLPKSGKTTIADLVYDELKKIDVFPLERIDSKDIRDVIPELGYSKEERTMHLKRIGILIKRLQNNHISVVASFVSPYKEVRECLRGMTQNFTEIYTKASIKTCMERDKKGVYKEAIEGKRKNFTGISDPYDEPENPDIIIDTEKFTPEENAKQIILYVKKKFFKL